MSRWKVVGLAGIVGAAAVGVAAGAAAANRKQREYAEADPDDLRQRLHDRLAEADAAAGGDPAGEA